jgi:hypothetical protein
MTVLPFLKRDTPVKIEDRNQESKPRSIILPVYLWELIEKDAKRCRRSMNKHIEAILVLYYGVESSVNINEEALTSAQDAVTHKPKIKKTA